MAIAVTSKVTKLDFTLTTTLTTGAFTSVTDNYYLVAISYENTISTVTSSNGITFTKIQEVFTSVDTHYCSVWGGLCSAGSSGTVTVTPTTVGANEMTVAVNEVTGHDTTGTIVQSASAGALTLTLSAITGSNGTYMAVAHTSTADTKEAGWTNINNDIASWSMLLTAYKAAGDNTPSYTNAFSRAHALVGIELKVFVPPAANTTQATLMLMGYGL